MVGQGPGNSRESARLPLAFSDYIYSIIVEDTGFIGGALVLLLYLLLVARAGRIAYMCSRAFPAFLIMGCAVMIVFQALVHMAIVTGVFPVSGQPLPFILERRNIGDSDVGGARHHAFRQPVRGTFRQQEGNQRRNERAARRHAGRQLFSRPTIARSAHRTGHQPSSNGKRKYRILISGGEPEEHLSGPLDSRST